MDNIKTEVKDNKLIITIDVSKKVISNAPESKSGKTCLVATTGGAHEIKGLPLKLALNLMTPNS